jgi:hypothetical protein
VERAKPRQKKMDQQWISSLEEERRRNTTTNPTRNDVAKIEWNRRGSNVGDRTDGICNVFSFL